MKYTRGLFTDCSVSDQPEGTYRHAKNIVITEELGAVKFSEEGFTEQVISGLPDAKIIGWFWIGGDWLIFQTDNVNHYIGISAGNTYQSVLSSNDIDGLDFDEDFPIKIEWYINNHNERVVSFIDWKNKPRILNIDNPQVNDINDLNIFADAAPPSCTMAVNETGGNLKTGAYYTAVKYIDDDLSETNWFFVSGPVYINQGGSAFETYEGAAPGSSSPKSIAMTFSEFDQRFSRVKIAVISLVNNIYTSAIVNEINVSAGNSTITYTGAETTLPVPLSDILTNEANYSNAKAITQLNNRLYLGNMTADVFPDYQGYANSVKIDYSVVDWVNVRDLNTSYKHNLRKGFYPGEVYAFYIGWILKAGGAYSKAYHVPGRAAVSNEKAYYTDNGLIQPKFQVNDTSDYAGASSNMGYWENSSEQYGVGESNEDLNVEYAYEFLEHLNTSPVYDSTTGKYRQTDTIAIDPFYDPNADPLVYDPTVISQFFFVGSFVNPDVEGGGSAYQVNSVTTVGTEPGQWSVLTIKKLMNPLERKHTIINTIVTYTIESSTVTPSGGSKSWDVIIRFDPDDPANSGVNADFWTYFNVISNSLIGTNVAVYHGGNPYVMRVGNSGYPATGGSSAWDPAGIGGYYLSLQSWQSSSFTDPGIDSNLTTNYLTGHTFFDTYRCWDIYDGTLLKPIVISRPLSDTYTETFTYQQKSSALWTASDGTQYWKLILSVTESLNPGVNPIAWEGSNLGMFFYRGRQITVQDSDLNNRVMTVLSSGTQEVTLLMESDTAYNVIQGTSIRTAEIARSTSTESGEVRHHRFPTLSHILERVASGDITLPTGITASDVGRAWFPILGIDVSNVQIPDEIKDKVVGWQMFYAKKTPQNRTMLGQDLLQFSGFNSGDDGSGSDGGDRVSTAGNWKVTAEKAGTDTWEDMMLVDGHMRGHCLDMFWEGVPVRPDYVRFYHKLASANMNASYTGFGGSGGTLHKSGQGDSQTGGAVSDFTNSLRATRGTVWGEKVGAITQFDVLPGNFILGKVTTTVAEPILSAASYNMPTIDFSSFGGAAGDIAAAELLTNSPSQSTDDPWIRDGAGLDTAENTALMEWCKTYASVHAPYDIQPLVATDIAVIKDFTGIAQDSQDEICGGDAYITLMSYLSACHENADTAPDSGTSGVRAWKVFGGYSHHNWAYRYNDPTNQYTDYFPKVDPADYWKPQDDSDSPYYCIIDANEQLNQLKYNNDYSAVNDIVQPVISNPSIRDETRFPNLIVRSPVQGSESDSPQWKTFLVADRYTTDRRRGPVMNLQNVANENLIIHQRDSLFITRDRTTVQADGTKVSLGAGDIFDLTPREILTSQNGLLGTIHPFGCSMNKLGYCFADSRTGKIFVLRNGQEAPDEISSKGMSLFFRNYMTSPADNPYKGTGYSMIYNEDKKVLLVSLMDDSRSFTLSYFPQREYWVSYHDYIPDGYIAAYGKDIYSLKDGNLYFHKNGPKGVYYDTTPKSSFIDVVFNPEGRERKIFQAIDWASVVIDDDLVSYVAETFDYVTLWNDNKQSDKIPISLKSSIADLGFTARKVETVWHLNTFRNIAQGNTMTATDFYNDYTPALVTTPVSWFRKSRFIDRYLICRLEYLNSYNKTLMLLDANISYRKSPR